jgi:hypothetical protein
LGYLAHAKDRNPTEFLHSFNDHFTHYEIAENLVLLVKIELEEVEVDSGYIHEGRSVKLLEFRLHLEGVGADFQCREVLNCHIRCMNYEKS